MAGGALDHAKERAHASMSFKHEHIAMLCYFMLGCGFLAGWNAFLTATDYFYSAFPGHSVDRLFTSVYLPLTFGLVGLVARFPRLLWSGRVRIIVAYSLFTLCCAAIPVIDALLVHAKPASSVNVAFGLSLLAVALVAVGDGLSQGTVLGDAALLPDKYTRAVVMGMSASGVTIGILRIATKGALPQDAAGLRVSTQIYFAAASAITATCLLLYELVMPRLDVVRYYRAKLAAEQARADVAAAAFSAERGTVSPRDSFISVSLTGERLQGVARSPSALSPASSSGGGGKDVELALGRLAHVVGGSSDVRMSADAAASPKQQQAGAAASTMPPAADGIDLDEDAQDVGLLSWRAIFKLNWKLCVAVFMVYAVTLSIFPGFLAENVHSAVLRDWYPVLLIFSFNVMDFAGRCMPTCGWTPSHTLLLLLALARLAFEPLYAVLSIKGAHEAVFFVLTIALGWSNGALTALIFMAAPRGLSPSAAELAGMLNVFCELAGLNVGAFAGWLWTIGK